jgi:hypothetical protein
MADFFSDDSGKGFQISMKWEGFAEFEQLLDQINDDFGAKDANKILQNACRASMIPVLHTAKSLLQSHNNIETGQLHDSLQVEARKPTARDKRSRYSSPTMVMIARVTVPSGKVLARKSFKNRKNTVSRIKQIGMESDGRAFAIEFGTARWHKGEGMPFIRPALESNAVSVTNNLGKMLGNALLKYKSKRGI